MNLRTTFALFLIGCLVASIASGAEPDCTPQTAIDVAGIVPQVIVVGERHGTQEIPAYVAGLVCSLVDAKRSVILALETDGAEQEALNRYVASDGTPRDRAALLATPRWQDRCQDGRKSEAMLALIDTVRRLNRGGKRVGIVALGANENLTMPLSRQEEAAPLALKDDLLAALINDRMMADRLLLAALLYRDYTIVSLSGFTHASTLKGNRRDPEFLPMGYRIVRQPPAFFIGFDTGGGTSWTNNGPRGCGESQVTTPILYSEGTQLDAVVNMPNLNASPPAARR